MIKTSSVRRELGDAMLAQQADLMDAIQRLRDKARSNDKLSSNKQQTVSVKQQEGKQVVVIEQADPNEVYVPYYDPAVVFGAWPYAAYPQRLCQSSDNKYLAAQFSAPAGRPL